MGTRKQIMKMLNIAEKTFYNWKNQKRPAVMFFEKYLSDEEISEFLETGMIKKLEILKMQELQSDDYARMSDIHKKGNRKMTYKEIEKDVIKKIEIAIAENVEKYSNGISTIAEYSYYDELLKVNSKKWTNNARDLRELKIAIIECEQFLKDELLAYNNVELEGECEEGYPVWVEQIIEAKVLRPYQKLDEVPRESIDKIIKIEIKKMLSISEIDCKILELFKDGVLDFETFKKISTALKGCEA